MQNDSTFQSHGRHLAGWAAGLLGLALITTNLWADPGDLFSPNGPGGGVGTLPSTADESLPGLPVGPYDPFGGPLQFGQSAGGQSAAAPALTLRGLEVELDAWIQLAYSPDGSGWFELSSLAADGTRSITFHGDVVVELDRAVMHAGGVTAALSVDPAGGGQFAALRAGDLRTAQPLPAGEVTLPLRRATRAGLFGEGLQLTTASPGAGITADFNLTTVGRTLVIHQDH